MTYTMLDRLRLIHEEWKQSGPAYSSIVRTPALKRVVSIIGGPKCKLSPSLQPVVASSR